MPLTEEQKQHNREQLNKSTREQRAEEQKTT